MKTFIIFITFFFFYAPSILAFSLKTDFNDTGSRHSDPTPPNTISQTFTASANNLTSVELMLYPESPTRGTLNLFLTNLTTQEMVASSSSFLLISSDYFYPLSFLPIPDSQAHQFQISASFIPDQDQPPLSLKTSRYNRYFSGSALTNNQLQDYDIVFRAYSKSPPSILSLALSTIRHKLFQDPLFFTLWGLSVLTLSFLLIRPFIKHH